MIGDNRYTSEILGVGDMTLEDLEKLGELDEWK